MSAPAVRQPLHILIIHSHDATEGYAEYLRSEGFLTTEAIGSADGIETALEQAPDLIVLDFDLDGETTGRLKADMSTRGIPVIALAKMEHVRTHGHAPS